VKEFYPSFNDEVSPSSNVNVEPTFEPLIEDVYSEDFKNDPKLESSGGEDFVQVIRDMELALLEVKASIGKYRKEEMKYKMDAIKGCLQFITEPFTFERPSRITLPSKGFIAPIQQNVQRTRMGHGRIPK